MMKRLLLLLLVLGVGLGSAAVARGDSIDNLTFALSNNGAISGNPGSTPGWGFTLTNTLNYVVIDASEFGITQNSGDGSYMDIIGPNFIVVGTGVYAGTPITQAFDASVPSGVGSFAILPSATIGDVVLGNITLTYDVYSVSPNDPSFDPFADSLAKGLQISAGAQVDVTPEPGTLLLVLTATGLGLALLPRLGRAGA
ncbi:MAG TPA: hypothetical protein VKM93_22725 [Terriglobia bacterium]|nr:hypothetical protein [Terriglobia bacterium]